MKVFKTIPARLKVFKTNSLIGTIYLLNYVKSTRGN